MATSGTRPELSEPDQWLYSSTILPAYVSSLAEVTDADVARFAVEGFLAVRQVVPAAAVADALAGLADVLDSPGEAMVEYESWATDRVAESSGVERMDLVRKLMWFVHEDDRLAAIAADPALVGLVRRLAGVPEVRMFQDMALLKPPGGGREKPWHQDNAFFALEPGTPIVGVWIALDPATPENGCMHVLPGTHTEGPVLHFKRRDLQICDTDVQTHRDVVVPLEPGDALFFHGLVHHGTPSNRTASRRRALQFHYLPSDATSIDEDRRVSFFGGDALGAEC